MILSCQNIGMSFGDRQVLKDVTFQIEENDKLAVVGSNGAGKTTLLRIITGELVPDDGVVTLGRGVRVGYLAQYQDTAGLGTIYDIVMSSKRHLLELEHEIRRVEQKMSGLSGEELEAAFAEYEQLNHQFEQQNGYACRSEVTGVLKGLGFAEEDFGKTMDMLSGGEKTRVSLGKLLVTGPDLLLLDEPINHLDMSAIQWLENYLMNYRGTVVIVAHDRYFLDRIADKVLDISPQNTRLYQGNYSTFVNQKAELLQAAQKGFEKQQREIARQEQVIEKLKSFNREKSIKRAESRQKLLNKMERLEAPEAAGRGMSLSLEPETVSGKDVLVVENLSKAFSLQEPLFTGVNFSLQRGERIAIIGDNGCGKTTILKTITGRERPDEGLITLGANVTVGYYDQEQQALDDAKSLFEEMQDTYPGLSNTRIRNVLAAFLFTGDDVHKKIGDLSGGERGRVSLAKLMLSGANFLILDEPTNHLDMESKEILENALLCYTGSLLYVSHDRYFINRTAQKILELADKTMTLYYGNYDYYLEKRGAQVPDAAKPEEDDVLTASKADWAEQKKLSAQRKKAQRQLLETEERIASLEEKLQSLDDEFSKEENAYNSARLNELNDLRQDLSGQLETLYDLWEKQSESDLLNL